MKKETVAMCASCGHEGSIKVPGKCPGCGTKLTRVFRKWSRSMVLAYMAALKEDPQGPFVQMMSLSA